MRKRLSSASALNSSAVSFCDNGCSMGFNVPALKGTFNLLRRAGSLLFTLLFAVSSAAVPPKTYNALAPATETKYFTHWLDELDPWSDWVRDSENYIYEFEEPFPDQVIDKKNLSSIIRIIQKIKGSPKYASLTEKERFFLDVVLEHLKKLTANRRVFNFEGGGANIRDYLAGAANEKDISLEETFFKRGSPLYPFLKPALVILTTRSIYWSLAPENRPQRWTRRLNSVITKLFGPAGPFKQALWRWRVQTVLRFLRKNHEDYHKKPKPVKTKKRSKEKDWKKPDAEESLVIDLMNSKKRINGLKKAGEYLASQFAQGARVVSLGMAEETPNALMIHPKLRQLLWHTFSEESPLTHVVFQIPKFQRVNIKIILEEVLRSGQDPHPHKMRRLRKAFAKKDVGLDLDEVRELLLIFKMIYHYNHSLPENKQIRVIILNENFYKTPKPYYLFEQMIEGTFFEDPNARVLFISELIHAERNSTMRNFLEQFFRREELKSVFVSPSHLLDADFVGVTMEEVKYLIDFVLKDLPSIGAIRNMKIRYRQFLEFQDFDHLICFADRRRDDDDTDLGDNDDDPDSDPAPDDGDPLAKSIPIHRLAGIDMEMIFLIQVDEGWEDFFGRSL